MQMHGSYGHCERPIKKLINLTFSFKIALFKYSIVILIDTTHLYSCKKNITNESENFSNKIKHSIHMNVL